MFISITIETSGGRADIRIDSEQLVGEGLKVLRESDKLPEGNSPDYFRSRLREKTVSAYMTFAAEKVYDGDILTAIE
ncbi:MAG: hypothetical protein FWC13_02305 [Oscillospiraceae bacterium]|nr:hypothetical protein [Oscillospiraceae bacterium]